MTSKLTRERLQEIAEDGFLKHGESKELARMALAAMDSEPVAYWRKALRADGFCYADGINSKRYHDENPPLPLRDGDYWEVIPLYRHAQPAPASEPIGFRCRRNDGLGDWFHVYHRAPDEFERKHLVIENIYTAPQPAVDSEPVGYFRRYDPDFDALITQCDKGARDSFPLYLHGQSEPIGANIARDAQRYRFLRDKDAFGDDGEPGLASWDELIELDMNDFDAAIDARMAHPSVDFLTLDNALQKQERLRCKDRNCNKQIFGYSVDGLCEDCYTAVSQQPAPESVADDVRNVITLLENNEWAEHCTKTELGQRLEIEITRLVGRSQPAPVVQCPFPCGWDSLNKLAIQNSAMVARYLSEGEQVTEEIRQAAISNNDSLLKVIAACRAAMLQAAPVRSSMPDGVVTAEHRRVIEMLLNVCGAAFELADDSCQQDVDGEDCHVVPDDAFQKLSDALDEIENTLPTEDIDRPDVFLAWSAMPRAALKSLLQAGNSPVIPEGYVMVPKVPTEDMIAAAMNCDDVLFNSDESFCVQFGNIYEAMLAAAPQEVKP